MNDLTKLVLCCFLVVFRFSNAQDCSRAGLLLPDTVCLTSIIPFQNNKNGAGDFKWDFCPGDFDKSMNNAGSYSITTMGTRSGAAFAQESAQNYVFVTSRNLNKLFRLNYGSGFSNTPTVTDLGSFGTLLRGPESIHMLKEGNTWYAFIVNLTPIQPSDTVSVVRLSFTNGLGFAPVAEEIPAFKPFIVSGKGIRAIRDRDSVFLAVGENGAGTRMYMAYVGNSVSDTVSLGNIKTYTLPLRPNYIDLYSDCEERVGFLASTGGQLIRLRFPSSFFESPVSSLTTQTIGGQSSVFTSIQKSKDGYTCFSGTNAGRFIRFRMGNNFFGPQDTTMFILQASGTYTTAVKIDSGSATGFLSFILSNTVSRFVFQDTTCDLQISFSNSAAPSGIIPGKQGYLHYEHHFTDSAGHRSKVIDSVFIVGNIAVDFQIADACEDEQVNFSDNSTGYYLKAWSWDFGDGFSATGQNVQHIYLDTGVYSVKLTVSDSCGTDSLLRSIRVLPKPIPNFQIISPLCSSAPVYFQDSSVLYGDTSAIFDWNFGNNTNGAGNLTSTIFIDSGQYLVTLTVTGSTGCDSSFSKMVQILNGPVAAFGFLKLCKGDTTSFLNNSTGQGIIGYHWNFGTLDSSNSINPVFFFPDTGNYVVSLAVSDLQGCITTKAETVRNYSLPTVDFTTNPSCMGLPMPFSNNSFSVDNQINNWLWNFGDTSSLSNTSFLQNPAHTYQDAGSYMVKLVATTPLGCTDSVLKPVLVRSRPVSSFSFNSQCEGVAVPFQDQSNDFPPDSIITRFWTFGDTASGIQNFSTLRNPSHVFADSGLYSVSLLVISTTGCSKDTIIPIRIYDKPTIARNIPSIRCVKDSIVISDQSIVIYDSVFQTIWTSPLLPGPSISPDLHLLIDSSGTYPIIQNVVSNRGCADSSIFSLEVNPLPTASFTFSPEFGPPPLTVGFSNTSIGSASAIWLFPNGSMSQTVNPSFVFDSLGLFDVRLVAVSTLGCRDTTVRAIEVIDPRYDVEVLTLNVIDKGGFYELVSSVKNNGNRKLDSLEYTITLAGNREFYGVWRGAIQMDETRSIVPDIRIGKNLLGDYACFTITKINGEVDEKPQDNTVCRKINPGILLAGFFPNPANDFLNLSILADNSSEIEVEVISSSGKYVIKSKIGLSLGLNALRLPLVDAESGLYILSIQSDTINIRRMFAVIK